MSTCSPSACPHRSELVGNHDPGPQTKPVDRSLPATHWTIAGKNLARKRPRLLPVHDRAVRCTVGRPPSSWLALHTALREDDSAPHRQLLEPPPDVRTGFIQRVDIVSAISELRREAAEASTNPLTRLPGSGPKQDYYPLASDDIVSPALRDIRMQVANLPGATDSYRSPPFNAQERAD
ncbi:DUF6308 family protein [Streptomyces sp. NPDC057877]|uniref:DUF6308 family protein n=1 Tax=Streptomyces sp. NPDC057877 TaxID=3346269 RepID=UPI003696A180